MDGRENKVTCQGGLDGDLRGFLVADLSDHDLIRVVTKHRAKAAGKRQTLFFVDGNLHDSLQLVLDRVLDRDDLVFVVANLVQRAVERGRLTRTGRPGHQDHSIRLFDIDAEALNVFEVEADNIKA